MCESGKNANEWLFQSISLSVKSADLCRCKVEMEAGNDGLEGELRQRVGRRAIALGSPPAWSDAGVS